VNLEIYEVADNIKARFANELWGDLYDTMEFIGCSDDPEDVVYEIYRRITNMRCVVIWKTDDAKTVVEKISKIAKAPPKLTKSGKAVVDVLVKKAKELCPDEVVCRYSVLELLARIRTYEHPNIGREGFCVSTSTPKYVVDEKCKKYFGRTYYEMLHEGGPTA